MGQPQTASPARVSCAAVLGADTAIDDVALIVFQVCSPRAEHQVDFVPPKSWGFRSSHALSARNARSEFAAFLNTFAADPPQVYEAALILGEILANTVEHAPGFVQIELEWTGRFPRVHVHDQGVRRIPAVVSWPDAFSERGRGLPLVHALATNIVVERSAGRGSEFSCTLPVERRTEVCAGRRRPRTTFFSN